MRRPLLTMIGIGVAIGSRVPLHHAAAAPVAAHATADGPAVDTVLERRDSGHFSTIAEVNGESLHFIVDTGADTVALTQGDARTAHVAFDPGQFAVVARGASGDVYGQKVQLDSVSLDGKRVADIGGLVLRDSDVSLLGQNYLRHLSVQIDGDTMRLR